METAAAETTTTETTEAGSTLFAGDPPTTETTGETSTDVAQETSSPPDVSEWAQTAFGDAAGEHAAMLANFKDPASLLKGLKDNMTAARAKPQGFQIPTEESSPEEIAAFREAIGVPESPDEYAFEAPEGVPDSIWNSDNAGEFAKLAHELNIPKATAEKIVGFQAELAKREFEAHQESIKQEGAALKEKWGDHYDAKKTMMFEVAQKFGIDPTTHPAFASADIADAFANIGAHMFAEDNAPGRGKGGNRWGSARDEYNAINDPNSGHPHAKGMAAGHGAAFTAANKRQVELAAIIAEEEAAARK